MNKVHILYTPVLSYTKQGVSTFAQVSFFNDNKTSAHFDMVKAIRSKTNQR